MIIKYSKKSITGETVLDKIIPNLNQIQLNGKSILEFKIPNAKNVIDKISK